MSIYQILSMRLQPEIPDDFTNPMEKEIIELERKYSKRVLKGASLLVLRRIMSKIKLLKSELGVPRERESLRQVK